jgi:hypothetical protein
LQVFSGSVPFGTTDESLLYELVVREDERPERPDIYTAAAVGLTDAIWSLIERSWASDAKSRPTASMIGDETLLLLQTTPSRSVLSAPPTFGTESMPFLRRKSFAVVHAGDFIRVFSQDDVGDIREYSRATLLSKPTPEDIGSDSNILLPEFSAIDIHIFSTVYGSGLGAIWV